MNLKILIKITLNAKIVKKSAKIVVDINLCPQ